MPNVHIVLDSADGVGSYNNFQVSNPGQNLVQGMIKDVAVSEIQFPYDLPNVMPGYNLFDLFGQGQYPVDIVIAPKFYTGTELAAAINIAIDAAGAAYPQDPSYPAHPAFIPAELPHITFSTTTNSFSWVDATDPAWIGEWELVANYGGAIRPPAAQTRFASFKSLLTIMGIGQAPLSFTGGVEFWTIGTNLPIMGSAPLVFTQFIDITSNKLSRFQYMRDGSSSQNERRTDIVARLYITNETSTYSVDPPGTRPFLIHRQFRNQRVFDWTTDGSVDAIDIRMFDDYGTPLPTWASLPPRPFQITFHAYQNPTTESGENVGYRF